MKNFVLFFAQVIAVKNLCTLTSFFKRL